MFRTQRMFPCYEFDPNVDVSLRESDVPGVMLLVFASSDEQKSVRATVSQLRALGDFLVEHCTAENDQAWIDAKYRLPIGTLVWGTVASHESFGVFVDFDDTAYRGLIAIPDFKDEGRMEMEEYPAVGTRLEAVILGHKEHEQQIWLGIKRSQLDEAREKTLH